MNKNADKYTFPPNLESDIRILYLKDLINYPEEDKDLVKKEKNFLYRHTLNIFTNILNERTGMPKEQVELMLRLVKEDKENSFILRKSFKNITDKMLDYVEGKPLVKKEMILQYKAITNRLVDCQVKCFKQALELARINQTVPQYHVNIERTIISATDKCSGIVKNKYAIDTHLHLGGYSDTLDHWCRLQKTRKTIEIFINSCLSKRRKTWINTEFSEGELFRLSQVKILRFVLEKEIVKNQEKTVEENPIKERLIEWIRSLPVGSEDRYSDLSIKSEIIKGKLNITNEIASIENELAFISDRFIMNDERVFLMNSFLYVLGQWGHPDQWFNNILTIYLVLQNRFHQVVTQNQSRAGLSTFLEFYDSSFRKSRLISLPFILSNSLDSELNVVNCFEFRTTPNKKNIQDIVDIVRKEEKLRDVSIAGKQIGLILHFIKEKDERYQNKNYLIGRSTATTTERYHQLRKKIREQAQNIKKWRNESDVVMNTIIGIDAARNEIDTPPEVFAPVFRYLRQDFMIVKAKENILMNTKVKKPKYLRATYHAGESFHHPVTGLRAVDEAIVFLDLRKDDRIGHGTVLGIDFSNWIHNAGSGGLVRRQERFDDAIWMYNILSKQSETEANQSVLKKFIRSEFTQMFDGMDYDGCIDIIDILQISWNLRWMDPSELFNLLKSLNYLENKDDNLSEGRKDKHKLFRSCFQTNICPLETKPILSCPLNGDDRWSKCPAVSKIGDREENLLYRLSSLDIDLIFKGFLPMLSLKILHRYQYDLVYSKMANEPVDWNEIGLTDQNNLFRTLQEEIKEKVRSKNLVIEICPSSNQMIGGFGGYENHPVFKLNTAFLDKEEMHDIKVSVNTDDPGVFSTDLVSEYRLLAAAARKRGASESQIEKWIDNLKKMSIESSFLDLGGLS
ncbi:hypothetical protein K8T06_01340 [bacterium]|nr:hypothetical protein [bacterium]